MRFLRKNDGIMQKHFSLFIEMIAFLGLQLFSVVFVLNI